MSSGYRPLPRRARIVIIGAGFSGLGMGHRLRDAGIDDFVILERNADVGGVWESNTYPGCICDVPSHLYSFSFAPNPDWSSTYSPQPEIRDYLRRCADRFGLRSHLRTGVEVREAAWREDDRRWEVRTSAGVVTAQVLLSGVGPLTEPRIPDIEGLDRFAGKVMHSARWDHAYRLAGRRVASIGTGASAIQYVPEIADDVKQLYVFQRSAPWVMPHDKRPISDRERARFRRHPIAQKVERAKVYLAKELLVLGFVKRPDLMHLVEKLSKAHIAKQVPDARLRALVTPDYTVGCKRVVPSNAWYPALGRPNVELVPSALREVTEHSVVDATGVERDVDAIIFGTGYHVTDVPFAGLVRGRGGRLLSERWRGSPRAYLGVAVPGFPNFFMFLGPNSGLGHSSMVYMIEAQIEHVMAALRAMDAVGASTIEVSEGAHDRYNRWIDDRMRSTVWETGGCTSYYHDGSGRNATLWPDWTWSYRQRARSLDPAAYRLTAGEPACHREQVQR